MPTGLSLPRLPDHGAASREIISFARADLRTLGSYEPGKDATIYDPAWTGARFPMAITEHELVHQDLTINTTFGFLTQALVPLTRDGLVGGALEVCRRAQWSVQELAATYCELALVAREASNDLEAEIRRLPSGRLGQPPYREVFEAIREWIPLGPSDDSDTTSAKSKLVSLLAFTAMNSDCLRRACRSTPSEAAVLACIADSPHERLERLVPALGRAGPFPALVEELRELLVKSDHDMSKVGPAFYQTMRSAAPDAVVWEAPDAVRSDAPKLQKAWREWLSRMEIKVVDENPMPKFGYGAERARTEARMYTPQPLADGTIHEFAKTASGLGQGIIVELATRDPSMAHVKLGAYLTARTGEPWPADDASDDEIATIPPDVKGLATPATVLKELAGLRTLPRVVSLLHPGLDQFLSVPGASDIFRNAVRVCRLTELSDKLLFDAILKFHEVSHSLSHQCVIQQSPQLSLGCILDPKTCDACVMVRLTSAPAISVFVIACDRLGFERVTDAGILRRGTGVFSMIGRF